MLARYGITAKPMDGELARVRRPVQMIWGERDPFGQEKSGRRAAAIMRDAELHLVPGGHAPWLYQARQVGALMRRFLDDRGGA
ncbi:MULTISPECIES: alpha/beta fold hydrolase [unclassified Spirillospora]|uniref:alpha/beta fold hydrolase n=1 Tax=unclassified Spirillospora TaxID=2642701 RepID=UPI00371F8F66